MGIATIKANNNSREVNTLELKIQWLEERVAVLEEKLDLLLKNIPKDISAVISLDSSIDPGFYKPVEDMYGNKLEDSNN